MVDLENLTEPLLDWEHLLDPIPGDCPSGTSLRHDPAYAEIREALKPVDTAPKGVWQRDVKPPDYPAVIKTATRILATQSKDLDVAGWLAEALTRQHRLAGLCEGLLLIRKLLELYWDTVHPGLDPEDGEVFRSRPLKHFNKVFLAPLLQIPITSDGRTFRDYSTSRSDGVPSPEDIARSVEATPAGFYDHILEEILQAQESVSLLQAVCDGKFQTRERPYLEKLQEQIEGLNNTVKALLRSKPATAQKAAEAETAAETAPPVKTEPAREEAVASAPAPAAPPRAVSVLEIAAALRHEDASNPVPYMLVRSWAFGPLLAHGSPVSEDRLAAPPTELRTALRRAVLNGDWWEVLDHTERAMELPSGACWLDIQQHSYRACKELAHEAAAHAIRGMTAGYLRGLPDLVGSLMVDGSPAASPDTVAWLRSEVLVDPQQARQESLDEVRTIDFEEQREVFEGKPPDAFEVAATELNAGRFGEAFRVLSEALAREQSGRGRMQRKLQLAKISLEAGQHRIALPILREIYQIIEERRLDTWEASDLVAPPLGMLYHCLEALNDTSDFKQRVYEKLCAVDPLKAWELTGKS